MNVIDCLACASHYLTLSFIQGSWRRRGAKLVSAHTVFTSWMDLGLLFMLVGMGMLVFGSLEYFIENEEPDTGFTSIPQVDCTLIEEISIEL